MFLVVIGAVGFLVGVLLFAGRRGASDTFNDLSERSPTVPSGMFTGPLVGWSGIVVIIFSMFFFVVGILNW
jgi:hypothetical protein